MLDRYTPDDQPEPRRRPRQDRSRITVEAVVEATAQLLTAEGPDAVTTTRVAERAGVSVGSLYQFFEDREALLAAAVEDHLHREREALASALHDGRDEPLLTLVERVVDAYVSVFAADPARSAAVYDFLRRADWGPRLADLGREVAAVVADLLGRRVDGLEGADADRAAFVLVSAVDAVVKRAAAQRPEDLTSGVVAAEARRLVRAYLLADTPPVFPQADEH